MAKDHSFDVVSEVDVQEVTNAIEQARKEIRTRYDFRDSKSEIKWDTKDLKLELQTESDFRLRAIHDILHAKFVKRGVSLKSMDMKEPEKATGGAIRQSIEIRQGIPTEKAREIVKSLKEVKLKVQATIQSDQVRVQSVKIDSLQEAMQYLRKKDFGIDLQFGNYR